MILLNDFTSRFQPPHRARVNTDHPLGRVLDYVFLGSSQTPDVDLIKGLRAPMPAGLLQQTRFRGRAVANAGTAGTAVAFVGGTTLPYIQLCAGWMNATGTILSSIYNSGGGYVSQIEAESSTQVAFAVRFNFGTQRWLKVTPGGTVNDGSTLLLCLAQVFSATDYRLYVNGLQANGTLSPGTFGSLNSFAPIAASLNGGCMVHGFGFGRALSDNLAIRLTKSPEEFWSFLIGQRRSNSFYFVPDAGGGGVTLTPTSGELVITGPAPTITLPVALTPTSGALTISGNEPTVSAGGNVSLTPVSGELLITGSATTITLPVTLAPAPGVLSVVGESPAITLPATLTPTAGALSVTGNVPDLSVGGGADLTPTSGALLVTGSGPAITLHVTLTPTSGATVVTGNTPAVESGVSLTPTTGALSVYGNQPSLTLPVALTPVPGTLTIVGQSPSLSTGGDAVAPFVGDRLFVFLDSANETWAVVEGKQSVFVSI